MLVLHMYIYLKRFTILSELDSKRERINELESSLEEERSSKAASSEHYSRMETRLAELGVLERDKRALELHVQQLTLDTQSMRQHRHLFKVLHSPNITSLPLILSTCIDGIIPCFLNLFLLCKFSYMYIYMFIYM